MNQVLIKIHIETSNLLLFNLFVKNVSETTNKVYQSDEPLCVSYMCYYYSSTDREKGMSSVGIKASHLTRVLVALI